MIAREKKEKVLRCSCCQKVMVQAAYRAGGDFWCSADCVNFERKHGPQDPKNQYCRLRPGRLYTWNKPSKAVRKKFAKTSKIAARKADEVCIITLLNSNSISEACKTLGISETRMRTRVFRWLYEYHWMAYSAYAGLLNGRSLKKVFADRRRLQQVFKW